MSVPATSDGDQLQVAPDEADRLGEVSCADSAPLPPQGSAPCLPALYVRSGVQSLTSRRCRQSDTYDDTRPRGPPRVGDVAAFLGRRLVATPQAHSDPSQRLIIGHAQPHARGRLLHKLSLVLVLIRADVVGHEQVLEKEKGGEAGAGQSRACFASRRWCWTL